jgi:hypothetical protein
MNQKIVWLNKIIIVLNAKKVIMKIQENVLNQLTTKKINVLIGTRILVFKLLNVRVVINTLFLGSFKPIQLFVLLEMKLKSEKIS